MTPVIHGPYIPKLQSMKVTVATLSDTVFTLDVAADMEVENFKVSQFLVILISS